MWRTFSGVHSTKRNKNEGGGIAFKTTKLMDRKSIGNRKKISI